MDRRKWVVESALQVVADGGLKGLTHRAVDRHAELVEGSTGNLFPRRDDLINALLAYLERRDKDLFRQTKNVNVGSPEDLAALLTRGVERMTSAEHASYTRVRLAMMPAYPKKTGEFHRRFLQILELTIVRTGADDGEARARAVLAYLDGIVCHALSVDPRPVDTAAVERVFWVLLTA